MDPTSDAVYAELPVQVK